MKLIVLLLFIGFTFGCSKDVCTPGETQTCVCPGSDDGAQVCDSDGASWGVCACIQDGEPDQGQADVVQTDADARPRVDVSMQPDALADLSTEDTSVQRDADTGPPCNYPPSPYGVEANATLDPTLSWMGFLENEAVPTTATTADLVDCDGSAGINAVLLIMTQYGSPTDSETAGAISDAQETFRAAGIKVWFIVVDDQQGNAPTIDSARMWRTVHGLDEVGVFFDLEYQLLPEGQNSFGTPHYLIVDPRTMNVLEVTEGSLTDFMRLEQLAASNAP